MHKTGIIILAAGNSSRLGRPKQLLPYRGKTLLSHVLAESLAVPLVPLVVVSGASHAAIQDSLEGQAAVIVYNSQWQTGMGSSIAAGLDKMLLLEPSLHSVIVAVCDQPYISSGLFRELVNAHIITGKGMVASEYSGTAGTPVLFDRRYFKELSLLSGDAGARGLLKRYPDDVTTVPFAGGGTDIDTEEDFRRLLR